VTQLTYKIAKLWGKPEGSCEKYDIDEKIVFPEDKDLNFVSKFEGKLTFIRLKDEISALLNDAHIDVQFKCTHCLQSFEESVEIPEAEREFFYNEPKFESEDLDDLFYINKKPMTIDLNEMVRQEIILHFPLIPVCSKSCKGLCQICGKDRNTEKCKCKPAKEEDLDTIRPFQDLKKLI
jgi:uncharacterized metal-binding protein YceD (DUF177 family)